MTSLALGLVLASAVLHASWNYFSKRIGGGGASFIWLFASLGVLIYAPLGLGVILTQRPVLGLTQFGAVVVSACIHLTYFVMLSRGYRTGDLSLVYPLARGTGPMLSMVGAVVLLGEHPSVVTAFGAILIGAGVFILTGDPRKFRKSGSGPAVLYALMTGLTIAVYTIWDKQAVSAMMIPPLVYDWISNATRSALMLPYSLRHWDAIRMHWRDHRVEVFAVALLSPLSYILMLTALSFSPVSSIAPAREISILIGAVLGARLLSEGDTRRRLGAASAMVAGVIALALG